MDRQTFNTLNQFWRKPSHSSAYIDYSVHIATDWKENEKYKRMNMYEKKDINHDVLERIDHLWYPFHCSRSLEWGLNFSEEGHEIGWAGDAVGQ